VSIVTLASMAAHDWRVKRTPVTAVDTWEDTYDLA